MCYFDVSASWVPCSAEADVPTTHPRTPAQAAHSASHSADSLVGSLLANNKFRQLSRRDDESDGSLDEDDDGGWDE